MTAQMTPPGRQSHWLRNASIGVIVVMVVLAVLGSAANRQRRGRNPRRAGSARPRPLAARAQPTAGFPDVSPSPPPSGETLLSIKGTAPLVSAGLHTRVATAST